MKNVIALIALVFAISLVGCSQEASASDEDDFKFDVKMDAPALVRMNDKWFAGVEGGTLNFSDRDEDFGVFVFGKITYTGTLLNLGE